MRNRELRVTGQSNLQKLDAYQIWKDHFEITSNNRNQVANRANNNMNQALNRANNNTNSMPGLRPSFRCVPDYLGGLRCD